jgi:type III pantothenate kinase
VSHLLAIDVGNTQTVVGLYGGGPELIDHWRISTSADRTSDELALVIGQLLADHDLSLRGLHAVIASVVPRVTTALRIMCDKHLGREAVVVGPGVRSGMSIRYLDPKEVGADRIADAVGAYDLFGGPTVVVDFGTATTVDVVSDTGDFLGGAIVPGLEISLDAMFERAAGLRRVELAPPPRVIGRSTAESISAGALYGYAAMIDGLCERYAREVGESTVVATGGLAAVIVPHSQAITEHEPWLTLHGLRLIHTRNTE